MRVWLNAIACRALWAGVAGLAGIASVAHAQGGLVESTGLLPPGLAEIADKVGLPGVLALLGWWARGIAAKALDKIPNATEGIPIVVRLSDEDRAEIRKLRRALNPDEEEHR